MGWEVALFILALAGVSVGCLLPANWLPLLPHDKWLHFFAFAGLTVLAARITPVGVSLLFTLGALLLAGWLIEVLQKLVPGRNFCWRDMAANAAGIAVAAVGILLVRAF